MSAALMSFNLGVNHPLLSLHRLKNDSEMAKKKAYTVHITRQKTLVTKAKARNDLNFTFNGSFPYAKDPYSLSVDPISESKTLIKEIKESVSFAKDIFLYHSPGISGQALDDIELASAMIGHDDYPHCARLKLPYANLTLSLNIKSGYRNIPHLFHNPHDIQEVIRRVGYGRVAAVFVEPVQGLGDMHSFKQEEMKALRAACDRAWTLLVFDETESGLGRTGRLWAHSMYDVEPDAIIVGFGKNIGTTALVVNSIASNLRVRRPEFFIPTPQCVAASAVMRRVSHPDHLAAVHTTASALAEALETLRTHDRVAGIRQFGLIAALELKVDDARPFVKACRSQGLEMDVGKLRNIVRMMPPADVNEAQIADAVSIIQKCLLQC